ncbi:transposase [Streptomyces griseoincarnatus]
MIWKLRSGARWREMPPEFEVWQTVDDRFVRWRDAGVFLALMDGVIAEAAQRGHTDLSLVSVDSTIARAHHDAAGMRVGEDALSSLEKASEASKGALGGCESRRPKVNRTRPTGTGRNGGASGDGTGPVSRRPCGAGRVAA